MELKEEVKELLISRTQTIKGISEKHDISVPTLRKVRDGLPVSDKTLIYIKSILS